MTNSAKRNQVEPGRALGAFTPMTDAEMDTFAGTMKPEEIALLREQWQKYASPQFEDLIDAAPMQEPSALPGITQPEIVKR